MQAMIEAAPKLIDHLGEETRAHFSSLCKKLDAVGISYQLNPRLVRGLDYYNRTVFEWMTTKLGSQGTIAGDDPQGYDEHLMQLAAYRSGLILPEANCANVFVSTTHAGLVSLYEWTKADVERGWLMFESLLKY